MTSMYSNVKYQQLEIRNYIHLLYQTNTIWQGLETVEKTEVQAEDPAEEKEELEEAKEGEEEESSEEEDEDADEEDEGKQLFVTLSCRWETMFFVIKCIKSRYIILTFHLAR